MDRSRELVQSASEGDEESIDLLLEQHCHQLRAFVRLRMGPELRMKESASDLVQSTCREVLQHLDRFQYKGENNFRQWLFTTALRKVKDRVTFYRAARRDVGREVHPQSVSQDPLIAQAYASVASPSQHLQQQEQIEQVEAAFDTLPEHYREVITLSKIVGLSHQEIGTTMGRSESSTRSLLYRALAELSEILQDKAE